MQLTGKQIVEREIIKGYCADAIQQQGIDVRVDDIYKVLSDGSALIPMKGKTSKFNTEKIAWHPKHTGASVIHLEPGYYEITLMESCSIPNNAVLNFKTRSSLVRNGMTVYSGQFDAGFNTDAMGCFLEVRFPVTIERGARIAQAAITETAEVGSDDLYNGQWQGDKQRNS